MDRTAGGGQGRESGFPPALDNSVGRDKIDVGMLAELRELRERFESKIRYDEVKERQIDALHEELQGYRQGLYQQIMQPVVMDLISIYDEVAGQFARISGSPDGGLGFLAEMIEEVLARYG